MFTEITDHQCPSLLCLFFFFFFLYSLWFLKMVYECHMGLDEIPLRVLWGLAEELTKELFIIYYQSWLIREVPGYLRLANVMPIHKKGWKEGLRNCRPVGLTMDPEKIMEQINLSAFTLHIQDNQGSRPRQGV